MRALLRTSRTRGVHGKLATVSAPGGAPKVDAHGDECAHAFKAVRTSSERRPLAFAVFFLRLYGVALGACAGPRQGERFRSAQHWLGFGLVPRTLNERA